MVKKSAKRRSQIMECKIRLIQMEYLHYRCRQGTWLMEWDTTASCHLLTLLAFAQPRARRVSASHGSLSPEAFSLFAFSVNKIGLDMRVFSGIFYVVRGCED